MITATGARHARREAGREAAQHRTGERRQRVGLVGRGRLEHGVDAALLPHEALGLETKREDHGNLALRRAIRCLSGRVIGHNMTIVINGRALARGPGAGTM